MIQQSVNQLINTAGIVARLSPAYENRQEAKKLMGEAKAGAAGLEAIKTGLNEPNKKISETQLKDISSRTPELNRAIYSAKIRGKAGDPLSRTLSRMGLDKLPGQEELAKTLGSIESNIASREQLMRDKAMENMKNKGQSSIRQDEEFKELRKLINNQTQFARGKEIIHTDEEEDNNGKK